MTGTPGTTRWLGASVAMAAVALAGSAPPAARQQPDRAAVQQRLADSRALTAADIDLTLDLVRQVSGGRPFHLVSDRGSVAWDIVVERDGHVRYIRSTAPGAPFSEYTGRIARYCDGTVAAGELVFEYRQADSGWTVAARASSPADVLRPIFDMLVGIKPMVDAGRTADGGRAFSAVWNAGFDDSGRSPAGGGGARSAAFILADPSISGVETLVIDPASLLPRRWEFAYRSPAGTGADRVTVPYRFSYDGSVELAPPSAGLTMPACIDAAAPFAGR